MPTLISFSAGTSLVFLWLMQVQYMFSRLIDIVGIGNHASYLMKHLKENSYIAGINFISSESVPRGKESSSVYYNLYNSVPHDPIPEIVFFIIHTPLSETLERKIVFIKQWYGNLKEPLFFGIVLSPKTLSEKALEPLKALFDIFLTTQSRISGKVIEQEVTQAVLSFYDLTLPGWSGIDIHEVKRSLKGRGHAVLVDDKLLSNLISEQLKYLPFKRSAFQVPKMGLPKTIFLNMACNNGSRKIWNQLHDYLNSVEETTEVLINLPLKNPGEDNPTHYPCTMLLTGYT